jgi:tight adherence protein B
MLATSYLAGIAVFLSLACLLGRKEEERRIFKVKAGARMQEHYYWVTRRIRKTIILAGLSIDTESFINMLLLGHVLGIGLGLVFGYGDVFAAVLAIGIPSIALGYLFLQIRRRQDLLGSQVEVLLESFSSSLYSNPAIVSAIHTASKSADQPMKKELDRIINELEHGTDIRRALLNLTKRINSEVLDLAVSGIIICRDTGGNMSRMLESLVEIARTRDSLQGRIRAMMSQQQTTARLVTAIPLLFVVSAQGLNPAYKDYFMTPLGIAVITYTIASVSLGFVWLRKMTDSILQPGKC